VPKDLEGGSRGLFLGSIPEFTLGDLGKSLKKITQNS